MFEDVTIPELLRAVLGSSKDPTVVFDADGAVVDANDAGMAILGGDASLVDDATAADSVTFFDIDSRGEVPPEERPERRALAGEPVSQVRYVLQSPGVDFGAYEVCARPIVASGRIVGAVVRYHDVTTDAMVEQELRHANLQLESYVRKLEGSADELALITEMGDFLQSCKTREEFNALVQMFGEQVFADEPGGVYLFERERDGVGAVAEWGDGILTRPSFRADDCWALRRGRVHTVVEGEVRPRCSHMMDPGEESYICLPMMAQGEALGVLHLRVDAHRQGGLTPGSDPNLKARTRAMVSVAEHIGAALANLTLRETLSEQALRDPLTQLFNRRHMQNWLKTTLEGCRGSEHLTVVMADLDHFKRFNDTFGHQAADEALRRVADLFRAKAGSQGIAARYGGEEFVLALKQTDLDAATVMVEGLRQELHALSVTHQGRPLGRITCSFGVAAYPVHGTDVDSVLHAADTAMYESKNAGRDTVRTAPIPGAEPEAKEASSTRSKSKGRSRKAA